MDRRLQRGLVRIWVALLIVFLIIVGGLGNQVRLVPLIDRPGASQYLPYVKEALARAQSSIRILLSDGELDGNPLWEIVGAAAGRGVSVRVLLDRSDWSPSITNKNRPTIEYLKSHGIPARFDDPAVTTHAKLVVIDGKLVILGSSNWNVHAFTDQEQANIAVMDDRIGEAFSEYFDRLWAGTLIPGGVKLELSGLNPGPLLIPIPEGPDTENYGRILLSLLSKAKESVHVVMYRASYYPTYKKSLSNDILNALVSAASRGLEVRVLLDDCSFYPESAQANREAARYLADHGIEVRFDDPAVTTHAKLVIIDKKTVLLGSTNWNYYALEKNVETDLAAIGIPQLAEVYERFFRSVWRGGRPLP